MKTLLVVMSAVLAIPLAARAEQEFSRGDVEISASCVVIPTGRILLVARDAVRGAVIFQKAEERPEGFFSKYESFRIQKEGIRKLGDGEVEFKRVSSKGFIFHKGISDALGPPLKLDNFSLCASPAGPKHELMEHAIVYFWSKPFEVDQKVSLAPTPWKEIGEVNLFDPRIRWFSYDEKRKPSIIPIDKIWD
jgi:hypothetical protein